MNDKQMAIMKEALTGEEFENFINNLGARCKPSEENPAVMLTCAFDWDCEDNEGSYNYWKKIHDRLCGV